MRLGQFVAASAAFVLLDSASLALIDYLYHLIAPCQVVPQRRYCWTVGPLELERARIALERHCALGNRNKQRLQHMPRAR